MIDLVRMVGVVWEDESLGAKYHDVEIPADMQEQAENIAHDAGRGRGRARRRCA